MLGALDPSEARLILGRQPLEARTPRTLTDVDQIEAELRVTRNRGYAVIDQEVELGLRSVAVPLRGLRGRVVAALNVGLSVSDASIDEIVERYLPPLLRVQSELVGLPG